MITIFPSSRINVRDLIGPRWKHKDDTSRGQCCGESFISRFAHVSRRYTATRGWKNCDIRARPCHPLYSPGNPLIFEISVSYMTLPTVTSGKDLKALYCQRGAFAILSRNKGPLRRKHLREPGIIEFPFRRTLRSMQVPFTITTE